MTSEANNKAYFLFSGGLLRGKHMTKDGFLFTACHEIGHHLGGFPKDKTRPWCSVEGQADYFANLRCMKEVLKGDPENAKARELDLPLNIRKKCEEMYSDEESVNICLRSTKASEDAFRFLQSRDLGRDADASLFNQVLAPVIETNERHPQHACRAETAFQGAICDSTEDLSNTEETVGTCHKKNGDVEGIRPACWFKAGVE